jgi:hypothetical protein
MTPASANAPRSDDTSTAWAARSGISAAMRRVRSDGGTESASRPSSVTVKPTDGCASASRRTACTHASASVRAVLRNFSRAGVAKNRSRTVTRVPGGAAAGRTSPLAPASTAIAAPVSDPCGRETISSRATAPIEGSASPRKPRVAISISRSSASLEVACRSTASASSVGAIPAPSSSTVMRAVPPPSIATAIRRAPASSAFSTSSFTTEAGRSTTSPAAMRSATAGGRRRMVIPPSAAAWR